MTIPQPRILLIVGARPNFMKVAPILRELDRRAKTSNVLLHSGQHYDADMSATFFHDLGIRPPDVHLGVGSASHGRQTADVLVGVEEVLLEGPWSYVVVVGDVNSTLAGALAAAKLGIPVAHVEAGLRSRDRRMPEEINRLLTDQLSDLCLTPSREADQNLLHEGIESHRIRFVGNVMIDTLLSTLDSNSGPPPCINGLDEGSFVVVTLHRPSNVDDPGQLSAICSALDHIAADHPVLFPVHPRTQKSLTRFDIELQSVRQLPPMGYREMLALQAAAGAVITDSGGIQEETTVLGVPCLTLRDSTERPVTITEGTNRLVPERTFESITTAFRDVWGTKGEGRRPEGWDGKASVRIADTLLESLGVG